MENFKMEFMNKMYEINWDIFKMKFQGREQEKFQDLCSHLFCYEFKQKYGVFAYENQTGIETEPIDSDEQKIGFQAKYFEVRLSERKQVLKDSIIKAKRKNPNLTRLVFYLNQNFYESSKNDKKNPKYKEEIEKFALENGIAIIWKVRSHFKILLSKKENYDLWRYFFSFEPEEKHTLSLYELKKRQDFKEINEFKLENHLARQFSFENLPKNNDFFYEQKTISNLLEMIVKDKQIMLLASAGMGKTYEIQYLAKEFIEPEKEDYPFYKNLKNFTHQLKLEDFLDDDNFQEINDEQKLLLLDGFDEIPAIFRPNAISVIQNFVESHPNVKIVISSRYNFYKRKPINETNSLDGFKIIHLLPLSYEQVKEFLNKHLTHDEIEFFTIPFNLFNYLELNDKVGIGTNKSKLMNRIIDTRIEKSQEKGQDFENIKKNVHKTSLVVIAFAMMKWGVNIISEERIKVLFDLRDVSSLNYSGILDLNKNESEYTFIHKNYQEYLASRKLMSFDFATLMKTITYYELNEIDEDWLNIVQYLFDEESFENKRQLADFIVKNQTEFIFKISFNISEEQRFNAFKSLFEKQIEKNQWQLITDFDENLIAKNCSIAPIIEYLLEKIENEYTNQYVIIMAYSILKKAENLQRYKNRIQNLLTSVFIEQNTNYRYHKYHAIWLLYLQYDLFDLELVEKIIKKNKDDYSLSYPIIQMLQKEEMAEKLYQVAISLLNQSFNQKFDSKNRIDFYPDDFSDYMSKISAESIVWEILTQVEWNSNTFEEKYLDIVLQKILEIFDKLDEEKYFDDIWNIMVKNHYEGFSKKEIVILFFKLIKKFNWMGNLNEKIRNDEENNSFYFHRAFFHLLYKNEDIDNIIAKEELDALFSIIGIDNLKIFDFFDEEDKYFEWFKHKYPDDFTKFKNLQKEPNIFKKKEMEEVNNLFYKDFWINEIRNFLDTFESKEITIEEFKQFNPRRYGLHISYSLQDFLKSIFNVYDSLNLKNAEEYYDKHSEYFHFYYIYEKEKEQKIGLFEDSKSIFTINDESENFVRDFCLVKIEKMDIKSLLIGDSDRYSSNAMLPKIIKFAIQLKLEFSLDKMLDLLSFCQKTDEFNYFAELCYRKNSQKTINECKAYLDSESQFFTLKNNHLNFIYGKDRKMALEFAQAILQFETFKDIEKGFIELAIRLLIKEHSDYERIIKQFLNKLIERNDRFLSYVFFTLKEVKFDFKMIENDLELLCNKKNEYSFKAALELISLNNPIGLDYLISKFKFDKIWKEPFSYKSPFKDISEKFMLPKMYELFEMYMKGEIEDADDFQRFSNELMSGFKNLTLSNRENYKNIVPKLENIITSNQNDSNDILCSNLLRNLELLKIEGRKKLFKKGMHV
jgi:hypothetical protein